MEEEMSKYKFIADGGHGWISVPLEDIRRLGITDQISRYSYMTHKRVYLEEDRDAGLFLEATEIDINSLPYRYSDYAKCRSCASYDPRWVHEPFGIGRTVAISDNGRESQGIVKELRAGHYIVEVIDATMPITYKYGIPASNPLKHCSPA
jgi:hypothetical protein